VPTGERGREVLPSSSVLTCPYNRPEHASCARCSSYVNGNGAMRRVKKPTLHWLRCARREKEGGRNCTCSRHPDLPENPPHVE